jgi:hypothetical protein
MSLVVEAERTPEIHPPKTQDRRPKTVAVKTEVDTHQPLAPIFNAVGPNPTQTGLAKKIRLPRRKVTCYFALQQLLSHIARTIQQEWR